MNAVMVVEDEQLIAKDIADTLTKLGYHVMGTVATAEECVQSVTEQRPDLVLMDIHLDGELDGIDAAQLLRDRFDVPVVFLSAYADEGTIARAKLAAPLGYLLKPFRKSELQSAVEVGLFRHQLERQLREREHWFSTTLRSIGEAVISVDPAGRISFMNRAAEVLLGQSQADAQGRQLNDICQLLDEKTREPVPDPVQLALARREVVRIPPNTSLLVGDRELPVDDSVAPIVDEHGAGLGAVVVLRDATEERRTRRQMVAADRLASLGALAAGIAHEINNPLTYILGNMGFLGEEIERLRGLVRAHLPVEVPEFDAAFSELDVLVREVDEGATRVSRIVADLGLFGRRESGALDGDATKSLEWALRVSHAALTRVARIRREITAIPRVCGDEGRLGQVFLNLLLNAAHAMEGGDPERNELFVSTQIDRTGRGPARVLVTIRDTGSGMTPEVLERIFDPFFTTKPVGMGTGLGLSVCHGVIEEMGGRIRVTSAPGRGAAFVVELLESERPPEAAESLPLLSGVRGRVLVVDDDPRVLGVLARMLGVVHEVVAVPNGRAALEELGFGAPFDVIVCDLLMPEMSGIDLYRQLERNWPLLARNMIFLSGGSNTLQATEFVLQIPNQALKKPPSQAELLLAVDRELQRPPWDPPLGASEPPRDPRSRSN